MRCRSVAIAIALLAARPAPAAADDALDHALAARLIVLGEHHYRAGEYYRAISAYEELALFGDAPVQLAATVRIAMSYHHGRQFADAVAAYDAAIVLARDPELAAALRIQRAIARAERTFDEPGADALDAIAAELEPVTSSSRRPLALYELARLQALHGDRERARATAATLATSCITPAPACDLQPALARALARPQPARRSPWLGVAMSAVIPGAGSLYGGHAADGLYYFALTALPALGAWDVYDDAHAFGHQRVAFYALGAVAAIFYSSGLLSAYIDVARHDEIQALDARRALWRDTDAPLPLETYAPAN
jgi:hypothetical protein